MLSSVNTKWIRYTYVGGVAKTYLEMNKKITSSVLFSASFSHLLSISRFSKYLDTFKPRVTLFAIFSCACHRLANNKNKIHHLLFLSTNANDKFVICRMKLFSLITTMTEQSAVTIQIGRRTWSALQTLHGLGPSPLTGGLPVAMIPTELCTQITWEQPWQISTYLSHRANQVHATSLNLWTSGETNVLTARHHSGMKKMKVPCTQIVTKISVNSTERLVQFITKTTLVVMVLLIHYTVVRRDLTPLLRSGWVASETMPPLSAALEEETWLGSLTAADCTEMKMRHFI